MNTRLPVGVAGQLKGDKAGAKPTCCGVKRTPDHREVRIPPEEIGPAGICQAEGLCYNTWRMKKERLTQLGRWVLKGADVWLGIG